MSPDHRPTQRFQGPLAWLVSAAAGYGAGLALALLIPPLVHDGRAEVPLWLVAPFVVLLASIAIMPFISPRVWHRHYPDFAFFLGAVTTAYYLHAFRFTEPDTGGAGLTYGQQKMLHAALEYYSFIALVGGLYVVSGGILVDLRARGSPLVNTALLGAGAVLANLVGTTGASMLLIRPFMRINRGRLRPTHIVFFIFIVSNCGGVLTPIGDPPLYLGHLQGVPFFWTVVHLWSSWLFVIGLLLATFFIIDRHIGPPPAVEPEAEVLREEAAHRGRGLKIRGTAGMIALALIIGGVLIDPVLHHAFGIHGIPIGATFQVMVAAAAYFMAPRVILKENDFTFGPVKEVGLLFLGIFLTMVPALAVLAARGPSLGINSPTALHIGTGVLSAFLDNAPTYLNFLQVAVGQELSKEAVRQFIDTPEGTLKLVAISTAAVFFGAMTYIGNGPNFMVKAVAESAAVPMPSFLAYTLRASVLLLPILILHWFLFIYLS